MAAGLTAAALRHRPRQAVLIVVLGAVVGASAILGPLYGRATEQSVLRTVLSEASSSDRGIVATADGKEAASPQQLARAITDVKSAGYGAPVVGSGATVSVGGLTLSGAPVTASGQLTSRAALCRHLRVAEGSCVDAGRAARPVLVSQRNAAGFDISIGDALRLADPANGNATIDVTVVGIYRPFAAAGDYWFGRSSNAVIPPTRQDQAAPPVLDSIFTSQTTVAAAHFSDVTNHADVPLRLDRLDINDLPALQVAARAINQQVESLHGSTVTALPRLLAQSDSQRRQTRTVVPLLAIQLAVLGAVVLGFVCAAATEARRPEVALSRLRGQGSIGATTMLLRELGLLTVVGALLGAVAGWLLTLLAVDLWLAPAVTLELRSQVFAAVAGAALAGIVAVLLTAAPTLRQPLVSLLRRVPPRASAIQVGLVEGALVAATAAGVVTLLFAGKSAAAGGSGSQSPVALLAPGLLAVAGGLLLAQAVVPASGPLARRALRRGRVAGALAATQVARRPALRRLIAIITVACALLVFAVDTWEVAGRNRTARAGIEAGAPVVLAVDAADATALRSAVLAVDPRQRFATPVVTARSVAEQGPRTTAVEPAAFARIAQWGSVARRPTAALLGKLDAPTAPPVRVTGDRIHLVATATIKGISAELNKPPPTPRPMNLLLRLVSVRDGHVVPVEFGSSLRQGVNRFTAKVPCKEGCLLRGVGILRDFGDFNGVDLRFRSDRLWATDQGQTTGDIDLGPVSDAAWQPIANDNGEFATVDPKRPLSFSGSTFGSSFEVQRGDVPVNPPALVAGDVLDNGGDPTNPEPVAVAPDLSGVEATYTPADRIVQVPRTGPRGVLVNLSLLDKTGPATTQTSYAVWLAADDRAREARLVAALERHGIVVTGRDSTRDHQTALASEGPTLALRLALLAGLVALVLAAAVLVVGATTSSGSRARDLAGLRVVGVPARIIRAAAVREHVTVAVLGTLAGVSLGLAAAQAALPRVPLFAVAGPKLPVTHEPAWSAVGLVSASCLVLLVLVAVFVGRSLAATATPDRLRQDR
jgi:putative ABC transport system permease protein